MRAGNSRPLMLATILLLYLAAGSLALQFVARPENIAYFWPAAGVSAGALIICSREMRLQAAGAVAVAVIIANLGAGKSLTATAIFTIGNILEAALCAGLVLRLAGDRLWLLSIREVNILVGAAALATAVAALFTMAALIVAGESTAAPLDLVMIWIMADFAGIVAVAPVFIAFANERLPRFDRRFQEGLAALGLMGIVAYVGYHRDPAAPSWTDLTAFSATLPLLVWIAARAPRQLAAAAPALVAFIIVAQTVRGFGPYAHPEYPLDARIAAAQIDLLIFAIMALYLSALFAGYRRALDEVSARRAELESRFSELEALYAEAPLGLAMLDTDLRFVRINEALAEMNGFSAREHIGRSVWNLVPALREDAEPTLRHVLETGEAIRDIEVHGTTPARPGQMREWCEQFYPIKSGENIVGIGIVCEEVTEKRRALNREHLLSREVDHRAKNLLAVVHSIVQLSQADDIESYRTAISSRIHALARTHSLIAGGRWEGAGLHRIVSEELAPFLRSGRIRIDGPDVHLGPSATQDIALVLHELATNAAKYGALSIEAGRLAVVWDVRPDPDSPTLHLDWLEEGGPPVTLPERQGFGSALVEATLTGQLKGRADFDWRPTGLHAALVFPIPSGASPRKDEAGAPCSDADSATARPLAGKRVLLVEDEPLIGLHAQNCLEAVGCAVLGPVARIEPAIAAAREAAFDLAILDINLAGQMTFGIADLLVARGMPFAFCSGYSAPGDIPDRFVAVPVLRKPLGEAMLIDVIARLNPGV